MFLRRKRSTPRLPSQAQTAAVTRNGPDIATRFLRQPLTSGMPIVNDPPAQPKHADPTPDLLKCSPPTSHPGIDFVLRLRRPILFPPALADRGRLAAPPAARIASVLVSSVDAFMALDPIFEQAWNLTAVTLGDLASTTTLAPSEQLTLEFQSSQRTLLDQSALDSTDSLSSSESTTIDKETVNVVRASSRSDNWHVDTSGQVTCGYASIGVNAGLSGSVHSSNQQAINQITDTTKKSAQSLKTSHKIEVRGVSEGLIQNRMTRQITNPYRDRSLSLNVYHLLKHYSVQTSLSEIRCALVFKINALTFDSNFVVTEADFLQNVLLDPALAADLTTALRAAQVAVSSEIETETTLVARQALKYLFVVPNMFNVTDTVPPAAHSFNDPANSFNASLGDGSALIRAEETAVNLSIILAIVTFFYAVAMENAPPPGGGPVAVRYMDVGNNAITLATALAASIGPKWSALYPDQGNPNMDHREMSTVMGAVGGTYTEIFRRIPGFLAMVASVLTPLIDPAKSEALDAQQHAADMSVLGRLIQHLRDNQNYYCQQYLRYAREKTVNQAIVDFASLQLSALEAEVQQDPQLLGGAQIKDFDVDQAFVDRQEIVVPGYLPLSDAQVTAVANTLFEDEDLVLQPASTVVDLDVPADGIHLEVAPGACLLPDVPSPPNLPIDASLKEGKVALVLSGQDPAAPASGKNGAAGKGVPGAA
jgi:hypothetical protein